MNSPNIQEQAAFHDQWNSAYRDVDFDDIEEESKARAMKVLEYLKCLPLSRPEILEVGCGTGWLTAKLCDIGPTVGIDLSEKAIEIANRRGRTANFIAGDFSRTPFAPARFDVAILVETIAYVDDQRAFLDKVAEHLKPGGYLLLSTVNTFVYTRRSDIGPPKEGQVRKWLTRGELAALLKPSFRVLKRTTVLPKGDRGVLRYLNAAKVNRVLNRLLSESRVVRLKEWLGLGHTRVVLAKKRQL